MPPRLVRTAPPATITLLDGGRAREGDALGLSRAEIAGTYVLTSGRRPPAGAGAVPTGELVLGADGRMRRTIRYRSMSGGPARVITDSGRYVVTSATSVRLVFVLSSAGEPVASGPLVQYAPGALTLTWGHPLDGPCIVERYERRSDHRLLIDP